MTIPSTLSSPVPASIGSKPISRDSLKQMIDRSADFTLIEVLDAEKFNEYHLPGAINIPLNDQFETAVTAAVGDKSRKLVVYCGEKACDASSKAAQRLSALGYTNVLVFEEGKKGWRDAPVGAVVATVRPSVTAPLPAIAVATV